MKYSLFLLRLYLCCLISGAQAQQQKTQALPGGISLGYTEAGSGKEVLILLHGLGGTQQHWSRNLQPLGQHYRCLAVDLPGYGYSKLEIVPEENILGFFAQAVVALMDSLSIQKAHLAGHSMGGQLAMLIALEHPERTGKLVLAAPAGIETFTEQEAAGLKAFAAYNFPQKQAEAQIRQGWAMNFSSMPPEAEPLIHERLQLNESPYYATYAQVLEKGVAGMLDVPVAHRLKEIKTPVLLLFGEEDKLIPNRHLHPDLSTQSIARQAKQALPNSRLVMLPDAGHLLQFEQPAAFNTAVLEFLKKALTTKKSTP